MRKQLNFKLVLVLLLTVALIGVGVHFLHASQLSRTSKALLSQAERAEQAGQLDQAEDYLSRYLALDPSNAEVLIKYGRILDKRAASTPARIRAIQVYEKALRSDSTQREIRRRVVDLEMSPGLALFSEARSHLDFLLNGPPNDAEKAELQTLRGRCNEAMGQLDQAKTDYEKALDTKPQAVEATAHLADLLRTDSGQNTVADGKMDEMVKANSLSGEAYLARARYREKYGLKGVKEDIARAIKLAPDDLEILEAAAVSARKRGDSESAKKLLEHAIQVDPRRRQIYQGLADLELSQNPEKAAQWLRKGTAALPDDNLLRWTLADVLLALGKTDEASDLVKQLREGGVRADMLNYLEGQVLAARGQWMEAVKRLEPAQVALGAQRETRELAKRALLLMGECQNRLGNPDQRYVAYRQAVAIELEPDPSWSAARLGLADSLLALNKVDEAIEQYRIVRSKNPEVRFTIARLLVYQNLNRPKSERQGHWPEIEQNLAELKKIPSRSAERAILRAEVLTAQDQPAAARALLEKTLAEQPDHVGLWIASSGIAEREGKPDAALEILKKAQARLGDRLELRLALVSHWSQSSGNQALDALKNLEQGAQSYSAAEQARLWRGLAEAYARLGSDREAERLWTRLAQESPNDLNARLLLFSACLKRENEADAERVLDQIHKIEGDEGTYWRYGRARLLIYRFRKQPQDKSPLNEARSLLSQVATQRPSWSRVPLSEAEIEEASGRQDAALAKYLEAIVGLGERNPAAIRRAVELLNRFQRFDQAAVLLQTLEKDGQPISGDLERLAASLAYEKQEYRHALELAEKSVTEQSDNYRDLLWLGQIRSAAGQPAESVLRRAVALAEQAPEAWLLLVRYLAGTGKKTEAETALQEAEKKLNPDEATLVLAQGYEEIGKLERASALYEAGRAKSPKDSTLLRAYASFQLRRGNVKETEKLLQNIVEAEPASENAAWARRTLPLLIASTGDRQRSLKALEAIGLIDKSGNVVAKASPEDVRASAKTLALQPSRAHRREAIAMLEGLVSQKKAAEQDLFLLAELYELDGDWTKAQPQMLELVHDHSSNAIYLAEYIRALLRHNRADEAQVYLTKLEQLAPGQPGVVEIRARVLHAQRKNQEVVAELKKLAEKDATQAGRVARLLEELSQPEAAMEMYQKFAAESGRPESKLVVAGFLGRQGRVREALDLCDAAWANVAPEVVSNTSLVVLYGMKQGDAAQYQRLDTRLEEAIKRFPEKGSLQFDLANLRILEGRYEDAEAMFRRIYETNRGRGSSLNNLAWMLACQGTKLSEASSLIAHAIELEGENPDFLDTRALVHLASGQFESAIQDLEDAIAVKPLPEAYFHLSQAYLKAGRQEEAKVAFRRAITSGLREDTLHPLERPPFRSLVTTFGE